MKTVKTNIAAEGAATTANVVVPGGFTALFYLAILNARITTSCVEADPGRSELPNILVA